MHPQLISRNANLPPNILEENAFAYQTNTIPYHLDTATVYGNLHSPNDVNDYDEDDSAPFDVSESESEDEDVEIEIEEAEIEEVAVAEEAEVYEMNYNLAITNNINSCVNRNSSYMNNSNSSVTTTNAAATAITTTIIINAPIVHRRYNHNCQNENSPSQEVVSSSSRIYHTQRVDPSSPCEEVLPNVVVGEDHEATNNPSDAIDCSPYYSDYISNEGQDSASDEDFFDSCNVGDESDEASRSGPSLSYRFLSDEGMSSDENEQENIEDETNANDWVICEELDL